MATIALGKASTAPAISAALFEQDRFYARQSHFSRSPKFYFHDQEGKTLAFVRHASFSWTRDVHVFTDPTLSFELLRLKPSRAPNGMQDFHVRDCVNGQAVGSVRRLSPGGLQCQEWSLLDSAGQELGVIKEDSLLLAGMRRFLTELVPQSYSFYLGNCVVGRAAPARRSLFRSMEIDLTWDCEKRLDRRLVTAAMVLLMAPVAHYLPAR
jgi:hypothetical protein